MYGLIGRMVATSGRRQELIDILLGSTGSMAGCRSYIIAKDPEADDAIWITEVWDDAESHRASLQMPAVQAAIQKAMPLIAEFSDRTETEPVGGFGL